MIELKKEIVIKRTKKEIDFETLKETEIEDNLIINTFGGLLTYIIVWEGLKDEFVETREKYIETYHYIVDYYSNIRQIDLSEIVINKGDEIYQEIIELIKEI